MHFISLKEKRESFLSFIVILYIYIERKKIQCALLCSTLIILPHNFCFLLDETSAECLYTFTFMTVKCIIQFAYL